MNNMNLEEWLGSLSDEEFMRLRSSECFGEIEPETMESTGYNLYLQQMEEQRMAASKYPDAKLCDNEHYDRGDCPCCGEHIGSLDWTEHFDDLCGLCDSPLIGFGLGLPSSEGEMANDYYFRCPHCGEVFVVSD